MPKVYQKDEIIDAQKESNELLEAFNTADRCNDFLTYLFSKGPVSKKDLVRLGELKNYSNVEIDEFLTSDQAIFKVSRNVFNHFKNVSTKKGFKLKLAKGLELAFQDKKVLSLKLVFKENIDLMRDLAIDNRFQLESYISFYLPNYYIEDGKISNEKLVSNKVKYLYYCKKLTAPINKVTFESYFKSMNLSTIEVAIQKYENGNLIVTNENYVPKNLELFSKASLSDLKFFLDGQLNEYDYITFSSLMEFANKSKIEPTFGLDLEMSLLTLAVESNLEGFHVVKRKGTSLFVTRDYNLTFEKVISDYLRNHSSCLDNIDATNTTLKKAGYMRCDFSMSDFRKIVVSQKKKSQLKYSGCE